MQPQLRISARKKEVDRVARHHLSHKLQIIPPPFGGSAGNNLGECDAQGFDVIRNVRPDLPQRPKYSKSTVCQNDQAFCNVVTEEHTRLVRPLADVMVKRI